uniref:Uncharacterized protein n=1 Tax=Corethron hystrix TaxID=216773 RepID=A0A7S1FPN6_9STRA|mmetsp:Transcript_19004/g.43284  ORF Transcript_19004/g.43284 Transcript_19004/m.43284 type:complete len:148 (+) Transcript_19004:207-650(+)
MLNWIWPKIRGTRETILSLEEIRNIAININHLKEHWCKYRRICHSAEDPIERTHAKDKHLERNFAHIRNPEHREDSKLKVRQFKRNPNINRKITEIKTKRKRNLKDKTLIRNQVKTELSKRVKQEYSLQHASLKTFSKYSSLKFTNP